MDLMMFLVPLLDRSDDRSQGFDLRLPRLEFFRRKRITGGPYEVLTAGGEQDRQRCCRDRQLPKTRMVASLHSGSLRY